MEEQTGAALAGGVLAGGMVFMAVWLAVMVLMLVTMWKIFTKAGQPGWASIVPIYNVIVMLQMACKPVWWIVLLLIPFVDIVIVIMVIVAIAKNFGKGLGFAVGMILLGIVFFPILAFGDAEYKPVSA